MGAAGGALVDDSGPQRYVVAMVRWLFIFTVPASPGAARSKIQTSCHQKHRPNSHDHEAEPAHMDGCSVTV